MAMTTEDREYLRRLHGKDKPSVRVVKIVVWVFVTMAYGVEGIVELL